MKQLFLLTGILTTLLISMAMVRPAPVKFKKFDHPDFQFYYPSKWRQFTSENNNAKVLVRLAPKREIKEMYLRSFDSLIYASPQNYLDLNKTTVIDSTGKQLKIFHEKWVKTTFASTQFHVLSVPFQGDLGEWIENRKQQIASRIEYEGKFKKLDDQHYVNKLTVYYNDKKSCEPKDIQEIIIHFYKHKQRLFVLAFMATQDKKEKYGQAALTIFQSFEFKN